MAFARLWGVLPQKSVGKSKRRKLHFHKGTKAKEAKTKIFTTGNGVGRLKGKRGNAIR